MWPKHVHVWALFVMLAGLTGTAAAAARNLLQTSETSLTPETGFMLSKQSVQADHLRMASVIRNSKYRVTPEDLAAQLRKEKDLVSALCLFSAN
jgi:hypothetical protein